MKRVAFQILLPLVLLLLAFGHGHWTSLQYEKTISGLKSELAHASIYVPVERDTITLHDTIKVEAATSRVIRAELAALREQHLIDEELIKSLGLKVKQLESQQNTVMETKDSARAEYSCNNKVFSYCDEWSRLQFRLQDSTFLYAIRDSLSTLVHREYKHRFLWWRWGTKGYKVTIINYNPHSRILYNTFIKPE